MTAAGVERLLDGVLVQAGAAPAPPCPDLASWKKRWAGIAPQWPAAFDRAVMGGLASDRLAWAFAAGYQSAVAVLAPGLPATALAAVCITEDGGAHPGAIRTRLAETAGAGGFLLDGEKRFVTGGAAADVLLVAASVGMEGRRNRIRMARVDPAAGGVAMASAPSLAIVPELPHDAVRFESVFVAADRVLPGDGYLSYIKPFRTIEDIHVLGAVAGHLIGVGRRSGWPRPAVEEALGIVASLHSLGSAPPGSPAVHLALSGVMRHLDGFLKEIDPLWDGADAPTAARWRRDRGLLAVADRAREGRRAAAWGRFAGAGGLSNHRQPTTDH